MKKLLHKPAEIQRNIAGTLPGKLKRKISRVLSYEILPLKSQKCEKLVFLEYFGDLNSNVEFHCFL